MVDFYAVMDLVQSVFSPRSVSISIIPCPSVKFTCFGMSRDSLSACYFLFYFDSP